MKNQKKSRKAETISKSIYQSTYIEAKSKLIYV